MAVAIIALFAFVNNSGNVGNRNMTSETIISNGDENIHFIFLNRHF